MVIPLHWGRKPIVWWQHMPMSTADGFECPGFFPVSPEARRHFLVLEKRLRLAVLSCDLEPSLLLVFQSRLLLGLLQRQFEQLKVVAACEGEAEACLVMARQRPSLLMLGDQLANGTATSLIQRSVAMHPDLRVMQICTGVTPVQSWRSCHALIADADIGLRADCPLFQGLMAMLTNTTYRSPLMLHPAGGAERVTDPSPELAPARVTLTPRERDILSCYAQGISNQEAAQLLGLSVQTVKTYSSRLLAKLGVNNRQKALRKALALGLAQMSS